VVVNNFLDAQCVRDGVNRQTILLYSYTLPNFGSWFKRYTTTGGACPLPVHVCPPKPSCLPTFRQVASNKTLHEARTITCFLTKTYSLLI
jgi:hypothetical protein